MPSSWDGLHGVFQVRADISQEKKRGLGVLMVYLPLFKVANTPLKLLDIKYRITSLCHDLFPV